MINRSFIASQSVEMLTFRVFSVAILAILNFNGAATISTEPYYQCRGGVAEYSGQNGTIMSGIVRTNSLCKYRITVDTDQRVLVVFDESVTEIAHDYVYVFDGPEADSPQLYRFSGTNTHPTPFISATNQLYITYATDYSQTKEGFRLRYYAIDSNCG